MTLSDFASLACLSLLPCPYRTPSRRTFAIALALAQLAMNGCHPDSHSRVQSSSSKRRSDAASLRNVGDGRTQSASGRPAGRGAGFKAVFLVPTEVVQRQVVRWMDALMAQIGGTGVVESGSQYATEIDDDVATQQKDVAALPTVLIATPETILAAAAQHRLSLSTVFSGVDVIAIDEPDALLRGLPDRRYLSSSQLARHPFFRHPSKGYQALEAMFEAVGVSLQESWRQQGRPRTLWVSATLTSQLRGFVRQKGWVERGAEAWDFTGGRSATQNVSTSLLSLTGQSPTTARKPISSVSHHALLVDPTCGRIVGDLASGGDDIAMTGHVIETARLDESKYAAALAELLQSMPSIAEAPLILIPTYGMSEARLVDALQRYPLDVETSLDHALRWSTSTGQAQSPPRILILSRSQVRGVDLPSSFRTVILLGGLCVEDVSPTQRRAGGLAEREREYHHFAGRVGRMNASRNDDGGDSQRTSRIITLVGAGTENEAGMQRMFERRGLQCEPLALSAAKTAATQPESVNDQAPSVAGCRG